MIRKKKERERKYVSRSVELIRTIIQVRYNLTMRFLFDLVHGDLCSRHFVFQKKKSGYLDVSNVYICIVIDV